MNYSESWYVAVDDITAGPAPTDLVVRGIEHRKIPPEALVCPVGARRWDPLASVPAFHAAVVRSYPPPPPESEEARRWMAQGFEFPPLAALPSFEYPLDDEAVTMGETPNPPPDTQQQPALVAGAEDDDWDEQTRRDAPVTVGEPPTPPASTPPASGTQSRPPAAPAALTTDDDWDDETETVDAEPEPEAEEEAETLSPPVVAAAAPPPAIPDEELAVEWDDVTANAQIDWRDPFESFFLVGDAVELPEEEALLESLATASRDTFRDESALWNLALCLAYGSDQVGAAAARAFFSAVEEQGAVERLDWMSRTLLGNGFVHSGIPQEAGQRAVRRLRNSCPPSLTGRLAS
jgi:hypothetical protein